MKLSEAIDQIGSAAEDDLIFARRPWSLDSEAEVAPLTPDLRVPVSLSARGFDYFLEANLALELFEAFGKHPPRKDERRSLLLYYAEQDALPPWLFELQTI